MSRLEPSFSELEDRLGFDEAVRESVTNRFGQPRLKEARDFFFPLKRAKLGLLTEVFQYWRDFDEYLLLLGENLKSGEKQRLAVKCSKRGNDIYAKRVDARLNFLEGLKNVSFFEPKDFDKKATMPTNLLWVTLTWDSKLCSLHDAWLDSYRALHKFKANLENNYGKIEWLTFIQPFDDPEGKAYGYPHIHILVFFKEASFSAFPHLELDREGKTVLRYRIQEKRELEHKGKWHSFIDVQAISSAAGAAAYCKKYARGVMSGSSPKAVLTCAMSWLYRKKSFTLTHGFQKALNDLIASMQVRKSVQIDFDGNKIPEWVWQCFGVRSASQVGVGDGSVWVKSLDKDLFQRLVGG